MASKLNSLMLASLAAVISAQGAGDAELHLLPQSQVQAYGAVCLDGSAPGYYLRKGSSAGKFKFHFQGGAWCLSPGDCYGRSLNPWGSSTSWPQWLSHATDPYNNSLGFTGLMNDDASNPFGDWTFIWVMYCDGSSYTSNRALDAPIVFNNRSLYMRGAAVLDGVLAELEDTLGFLSNATEVIISGTSAGGLTAYLHSSYVKSRLLNPAAKLVAVPDAGFFLDAATYNTNNHAWTDSIVAATAPSLWNSTLRGNLASCLADLAPANASWRCYFAQYAYSYLDVPTYVIQSMYDPIQFMGIFQLGCDLYQNCNASQMDAAQLYHLDVLGNVTYAQAPFGARDGYFLTSCYQHEESCRAADWYGITIGGHSMNSSFYAWYTGGGGAAGTRQVDVAWPGDNSCAPQNSMAHGAC